jgi:thiosulfate/3-mercaptopyruvate sulfurtransferase
MIGRPCMTTICGAVLLVLAAAAPAPASADAISFVDKPAHESATRVIDVRSRVSCEKASLPGARCLPAAALFYKDGRPVDFHTLRWLLGTIGLSGNESVLVVGANAGNAAAVGALLYLAGQRAVAVIDKPLTVPAKADAGSARGMTREAVFTAPMRDRLLVAAPDQARGAIASGPPRQRLTRFARMTADGTSTRLRLTP